MIDLKSKKTAVALGTFDGLHIGHMSVINKAVIQKDNGLLPVILLFSEHPLSVLKGESPKELFTGRIKKSEIEKTGCIPYEISFKKICNMTPDEFVRTVLIEKLNAGYISCGFNFRFGKNGSGDTDVLKKLGKKYNITISIADEVSYNGVPVSSTRIRNAVLNGDIKPANAMLGRLFSYDFEVVHGDNRGGRILGFPTINQFFSDNLIVPKFGVYASASFADNRWFPSMTNIGIRPTIGNSRPRSETCILGFSGDLYGMNTEVSLIEYIRPEMKFGSLAELSEQMKKDAEKAKDIFKKEFFK